MRSLLVVVVLLLCGAAIAQTAYQGAPSDAPVEAVILPWAEKAIGAMLSVAALVFWKWVDGIAASLKTNNTMTAAMDKRLALIEGRHTGDDKAMTALASKVDEMAKKMDAMTTGLHSLELRLVSTLAAHGLTFGKPSTNPGGAP